MCRGKAGGGRESNRLTNDYANVIINYYIVYYIYATFPFLEGAYNSR